MSGHAHWKEVLDAAHAKRKCVVGICAMDKKTKATPMTQILDRLRSYGEFEIIVFGNKLILDDEVPVEDWPLCDCLICFHSSGFPFEKAIKYVELRKPFCLNDVPSQAILRNRRDVYRILEDNGIPTPNHIFIDRSKDESTWPKVTTTDKFVQFDDQKCNFPLVEKPYDGDNHNINIYYGNGRVRSLFRKIQNCSSYLRDDVNEVRTDMSYVYEDFMENGKDLKVYTVGPFYAHGETRKSPTVDGLVTRDADGKELRLLTPLTSEEKEIARKIAIVFKQNICGFDIIRIRGMSYVIDVNGWSFVKGNLRYYDKAARTMRRLFLGSGPGREARRVRDPIYPLNSSPEETQWIKEQLDAIHSAQGFKNVYTARKAVEAPAKRNIENKEDEDEDEEALAKKREKRAREAAVDTNEAPIGRVFVDGESQDVLRAVVAVFRHADRTPKRKLKVKVSDPVFLEMFGENNSEVRVNGKSSKIEGMHKRVLIALENARKEATDCAAAMNAFKVKQGGEQESDKTEKRDVKTDAADAHSEEAKEMEESDIGLKRKECAEKLKCAEKLQHALEGIEFVVRQRTRGSKVQLKSLKQKDGKTVKAQLICKWGGEITHAGIKQTLQYAPVFWDELLRPAPAATPNPGEYPLHTDSVFLATQQSEYKMKASCHPRFSGAPYVKARRNFIGKIDAFASNEDRVRATAKAFLQASWESDEWPPSEAVLTDKKVQALLDDIPDAARVGITASKEKLQVLLMTDDKCVTESANAAKVLKKGGSWQDALVMHSILRELRPSDCSSQIDPIPNPDLPTQWGARCLRWLDHPRKTVTKVFDLMKALLKQIEYKLGMLSSEPSQPTEPDELKKLRFEEYPEDGDNDKCVFDVYPPDYELCEKESLSLMRERWSTLVSGFYDKETGECDPTKIPDVYDSIRYDAHHNQEFLQFIRPLYRGVKRLADFVVPHEYGLFQQEKYYIGQKLIQALVNEVVDQLVSGFASTSQTRCFLHFTSESHLHTLRNLLLLSGVSLNNTMETTLDSMELNYLSHGVFRLYEDLSRPHDDPLRFYVSVSFSPGAALDPFTFLQEDHVLPCSRVVPINGRVPFDKFKRMFGSDIKTASRVEAELAEEAASKQ